MMKKITFSLATLSAMILAGCATMGTIESTSIKPTKIYVSSMQKGTVTVIDHGTFKVLAEIPVGKTPREMVLSHDRKLLFLAVTGGANMAVIDTATDMVVKNIPVGEGPRGPAMTPDGKLVLVSNNGSGSVSVIDTASLAVIRTIPTDKGAYDPWITGDGKTAIVPNNEANTISFIDLPTFAVTTIATKEGPQFMALMSNDRYAFVANRKADFLTVIDPKSKKIVKELKLAGKGPFVTDFSNDNRFAYTALRDGKSVAVVDMALDGEFFLSEFDGMGKPHDFRASPLGNEYYITDSNNGIIVLDFTFKKQTVISVGKVPGRLSFSPDGKLSYVLIEEDGALVIFENEGNKRILARIPVGREPEGFLLK